MLVVLAGGPVIAPLEACLGEELEAEVVVGNLIGEVPRTVAIRLAGGGSRTHTGLCAVTF